MLRPFTSLHAGGTLPIMSAAKRATPNGATCMHSETADAVAMLDVVIRSRSCVRAFRPDPVPRPQSTCTIAVIFVITTPLNQSARCRASSLGRDDVWVSLHGSVVHRGRARAPSRNTRGRLKGLKEKADMPNKIATSQLVLKPYLSNAPMHSFKELMVHPSLLCCRGSSLGRVIAFPSLPKSPLSAQYRTPPR